jgi:hypothetical protein
MDEVNGEDARGLGQAGDQRALTQKRIDKKSTAA